MQDNSSNQDGLMSNMTKYTWLSIIISVVIAYYISDYFTKKSTYQYLIAAAGIPVGYLLNKKVYPKLKGSKSSDSDGSE